MSNSTETGLYFWLNLSFGTAFSAEIVTLWWLNKNYKVDDDFMKRAKYWLNFAMLVRTCLCFLKVFSFYLPLD
jgi:hypothetical protein